VARTERRRAARKGPAGKAAAADAMKRDGRPADNSGGAMAGGFGVAEIRRLIRLVQSTGIGELELSAGDRTVRISAYGSGLPAAVTLPAHASAAPAGAAPAPAAPAAENLVAITSPMVGTFYRAPAPDADPYVDVGGMVEIGQTVCIVEAMKLMNEIESEVKGRVTRILVENAQPVEFGQPLFLVEPA
jgi:acetyl-CoA carboxylase biotin carboxyl carrier protein